MDKKKIDDLRISIVQEWAFGGVRDDPRTANKTEAKSRKKIG